MQVGVGLSVEERLENCGFQALTMKRHVMKAETVITRFSVSEVCSPLSSCKGCYSLTRISGDQHQRRDGEVPLQCAVPLDRAAHQPGPHEEGRVWQHRILHW